MMKKLKNKELIDKALGISENESIDDFLNNLSIDKTEKISETVNAIDNTVKQNLIDIDNKLNDIQNNSSLAPVILTDINSSMKEVEDLIQLSKQMFKHVYESILTCDLVDSELIGAASKLLESIHINIAEFINLYRDKQKYIEKIKILTFQQEQRKEIMALKHQYDLEKMKSMNDNTAIDAEGKVAYSVEEITKMLNNIDQNN